MNGEKKREWVKATLSLAVVCLVAGIVLGIVFYVTEPTQRRLAITKEQTLVRAMLHLNEDSPVIEIRRYVGGDDQMSTLFLTPEESVPESFHLAGRFFIAQNEKKEDVGYVTEGNQYGFKSNIRFFVALDRKFNIQDIAILTHEEDPGLGAEISKPLFKEQFVGIPFEKLPQLKTVKGPIPKKSEREEGIIYGVTGATISSQAVTDGVKQAVQHLQQRLEKNSKEGEQ